MPCRNPDPGWIDVHQPANETGLGIADLNWLVRSDGQHGLRLRGVTRLVLLVHRHLFVRDNGIQPSVVLDLRQVPVVLDGYERIVLERFGCELPIGSTKSSTVEGCCVSLEQLLDDV